MKRILIIISLIIMAYVGNSQTRRDTVWWDERLPEYYYGETWIDDFFDIDSLLVSRILGGIGGEYANLVNTATYRRLTLSNPLIIKGVAIVISTLGGNECDPWLPEYFRICQNVDGEMQVIDQIKWEKDKTPIAYLLRINQHGWYPAYELYFTKSVTVTDSFFVGMTGYNKPVQLDFIDSCAMMGAGLSTKLSNLCGRLSTLPSSNTPFIHDPEEVVVWHNENDNTWHWSQERNKEFFYMFPILDTVAMNELKVEEIIKEEDIQLSPNPTIDNVEIRSAIMIRDIEVYATDGRMIMSKVVNGNNIRVNTTKWAKGLYLVHVHTLHGTVIRKLMVQ